MTIAELRSKHPLNVPVQVAAEMLGKQALYVQCGLKDGSLPFGNAVKGEGGRYAFNIPTERFIAYLEGEDMAKMLNGFFEQSGIKAVFDEWREDREILNDILGVI